MRETATAEVEIDRASVRRAIRMDDADVENVGPLLDDVVELFATLRRIEPANRRLVVEEARLSGTLTEGEYEEFLRWVTHTDLIDEVDGTGKFRLGDAVSERSATESSEE